MRMDLQPAVCTWCGATRVPGIAAAQAAPYRACGRCLDLFLEHLPPDAALSKFFRGHPWPNELKPLPRFRSGDESGPEELPLESMLWEAVDRSGCIEAIVQAAPATGGPRFRGAPGAAPSASSKAMLAVMFTDIQGSTQYFADRGDEAGFAMIERHNAILFPVLETHGGVVIKTIGDAIMGCFPRPMLAATAAVEMQRALREHNIVQPDPVEHLNVRIGIHFGEAIISHGDASAQRPRDVFGNLVNIASRIESLARGGEVFVSHEVVSRTDDPVRSRCQSLGPRELKGVGQPLEIFHVDWAGQ